MNNWTIIIQTNFGEGTEYINLKLPRSAFIAKTTSNKCKISFADERTASIPMEFAGDIEIIS